MGAVSLFVVGVVVATQERDALWRDTFDTVFERSVLSVSEVLGEPDLSESGDFAWHKGSIDSAEWDSSCDTRGPVRWPLDEVHLPRVLDRIESIAASEMKSKTGYAYALFSLLPKGSKGSISSDTTAVFGMQNYHTWLTAGMDDDWFRLSVFDC
jgi:hypothetical protein